jgi:hypothetical protein
MDLQVLPEILHPSGINLFSLYIAHVFNPMLKTCLLTFICLILLFFLVLLFPNSSFAETDKSIENSNEYEENESNKDLEYSPFAGMDKDGRIPKKKLPPDITNPDRWRYIPEGRIKPGNVLQRLFVSSFIAPILFFEQDVGAGGGVALTDIDFRQQRRQEFAGIFLSHTTEGQQRYTMVWQRWLNHRELENGGVAFEERSYIRGGTGYQKTLTVRFFGIGPDTSEDDETSYTEESVHARFLIQESFPDPGDKPVYRLSINAAHHDLFEGQVSGVPSTDDEHPDLFEDGEDYDILSLQGMLRYDTRDSQHAPYEGGLAELNVSGIPLQSNEELAAVTSIETNYAFKVPGIFHDDGDADEEHPPTDAFALGGQLITTHGELPFWALPSLGGRDTLRGYIQNRFTDRAAWHAAAEYRIWFLPRGFPLTETIRIERVGLAFFYDVGTVDDNVSDLMSATVHDSYGVSLRFSLERTALFRADLGFSDEGTNFTFAFGLSF